MRYWIFSVLLAMGFTSVVLANDKFNTPEEALTALESAYVANDLHAAILCKSFESEAENMLYSRFDKKVISQELIKKTAEVIELTYRKSIVENGFPDFSNIKCHATSETQADGNAVLTEKCLFSDGGYSLQKIKAYKVNGYWKVGEAID